MRRAPLPLVVLAVLALAPAAPARRQAPPGLRAVAVRFIETAVERRHPERARPLVTASIAAGVSAADWRRGFIRVVPFPYRQVRIRLTTISRTARQATLGVELVAAHDRGTFMVTLVRRGGRWLVDYWGPAMILVPAGRPSPPAA